MLRVITSTAASARLDAAKVFLSGRPPAAEVVVVGASRGAADDLVRAVASRTGATFGLSRFSLTELAARAAAERMADGHSAPGTQAGVEALAARAAFDARTAGELDYFAPVSSFPGFPERSPARFTATGCLASPPRRSAPSTGGCAAISGGC
jgi:hypothetical protein